MKERSLLLVILVLSVVIMTTATQSIASSMPSISGDYKLKPSSLSDDPLTSQIEVQPGQDITVEATAMITYNGIKLVSPPIGITTTLQLLKGSEVIATETQSTTVSPMLLEGGKTYTKTGSGKLTVPIDAEPGTYKLNCNANAGASALGQSMSRSAADSFVVQVLENPSQDQGNGNTVSVPPETPVYISLKKLLRLM